MNKFSELLSETPINLDKNMATFDESRDNTDGEYGGDTLSNLAKGRTFCSPIMQFINYLRLIRNINPNDTVVDVGSGWCELLTVLYANRIPVKYIGIEVNKNNFKNGLKIIEKINRSRSLKYKGFLIKRDITKGLPLKSNISDNTSCCFVIEHMNKQNGKKLFKELVRITKPEGLIQIAIPYHDNFKPNSHHLHEWKKENFEKFISKFDNIEVISIYYIGASINQIKKSSQKKLHEKIKNKLNPVIERLFVPLLFNQNIEYGESYFVLIRKTK